MSIWFKQDITLEDARNFGMTAMPGFLEIAWKTVGDDFIQMTMPITEKCRQPYGILHGGASCVLAETAGSLASAMVIDMNLFYCVGLEINANHIRSERSGIVVATCRPLHLGRSTHVWDIRITNEKDQLVCVSRLTVAIMPITEKTKDLVVLNRFKN